MFTLYQSQINQLGSVVIFTIDTQSQTLFIDYEYFQVLHTGIQ